MSEDESSIVVEFASNQLELENTQPLETFPVGWFRKELAAIYMKKGPKKEYRPLGTVLNAAVTEGKTHFILTKKAVADLMSEDPNLEHRSLDGKIYNKFMARMQATGLLEEVHRYSKAEGGGWLAGAYRVAHPLVLKCMAEIHGTEALEQHEKRFLCNYGKGRKSSYEYENENDSEPDSEAESKNEAESDALVSKPKKNIVRDEAETENKTECESRNGVGRDEQVNYDPPRYIKAAGERVYLSCRGDTDGLAQKALDDLEMLSGTSWEARLAEISSDFEEHYGTTDFTKLCDSDAEDALVQLLLRVELLRTQEEHTAHTA